MNRFVPSGLLLGAFALFGPVQADENSAYVFTLDGKPIQPALLSLNGTPDDPKAGDLVLINGILLTLGQEKRCDFKSTPEEDGRLLLVSSDGAERVVGARIGWTYKGDDKVVFNPLANLPNEAVHALWGVHLDHWSEEIAAKVAAIDPARTCITITHDTACGKNKEIPPLPKALRHLAIDERSSDGIKEYAPLCKLTALSFLRVSSCSSRLPFDIALIKQCVDLKFLDLSGEMVANAGDLAAFPELCHLDLAYAKGVKDLAFAQGLRSLRRLDVQGTPIADLSPLGGNKMLASVNADSTGTTRLPDGDLQNLRELRVMATPVTDEVVSAFSKSHPRCLVHHRWVQALTRSLEGVTRLRVRSGGTCHRNIKEEKTLCEEKTGEAIRALISHIELNESKSGVHCMCCGEPSLEFYKGDILVATLGFHHGQLLRWSDGWPGDGVLTPACATYLCKWLSERGIAGPSEEQEEGRKQEAAAERRQAEYLKLLPEQVLQGLQQASSEKEAAQAFENGVQDPVERARLCFRLYGCDEGSWNLSAGLDELLKRQITSVKPEDLAKAVTGLTDDPAGANGVSRWLFGERKLASSDIASLQKVLPGLVKRSLSHPREINRRRTIKAFETVKGETADSVLRTVLSEDIQIRTLSEDEAMEPGGMVSFFPGDNDVKKGCSDRAYAALVLAKRGDKASLPSIRELASKATGEDKGVLDEAVGILEKK